MYQLPFYCLNQTLKLIWNFLLDLQRQLLFTLNFASSSSLRLHGAAWSVQRSGLHTHSPGLHTHSYGLPHFFPSSHFTSGLPSKICFLLVGSVFNSRLQSSFIAWGTCRLSESPFVILSLYFRFLLPFFFSGILWHYLFIYRLFKLRFLCVHSSKISWNLSVNNHTHIIKLEFMLQFIYGLGEKTYLCLFLSM